MHNTDLHFVQPQMIPTRQIINYLSLVFIRGLLQFPIIKVSIPPKSYSGFIISSPASLIQENNWVFHHAKSFFDQFVNNEGTEQPAQPRSLIVTWLFAAKTVHYKHVCRGGFNIPNDSNHMLASEDAHASLYLTWAQRHFLISSGSWLTHRIPLFIYRNCFCHAVYFC